RRIACGCKPFAFAALMKSAPVSIISIIASFTPSGRRTVRAGSRREAAIGVPNIGIVKLLAAVRRLQIPNCPHTLTFLEPQPQRTIILVLILRRHMSHVASQFVTYATAHTRRIRHVTCHTTL